MISDPDAARRVSALMLEIGAKLDASIADVQASCPLPEFERYVEAFDVAAMWMSSHKQSEVFRDENRDTKSTVPYWELRSSISKAYATR